MLNAAIVLILKNIFFPVVTVNVQHFHLALFLQFYTEKYPSLL